MASSTGRSLASLALVVLGAACGDDDPPSPVEQLVGGYGVRLEAEPPRLVISDADGTLLLDGVPGGLGVARGEESYEMQYGSFRIFEDARTELGVARLVVTAASAEGVAFTLAGADGEVARGEITPDATGALRVKIVATATSSDRVSFAFDCAEGEHFLGLGGQSFDVDHRGERVALWVQEDGIGKQALEDDDYQGLWFLNGRKHSTHTPMPMLVSSRGYALLLDGPQRSIFDLCRSAPDEVRLDSWSPTFDLYVARARTPRDGVAALTAIVGRPARPPAFAFAPWLDALYGSANVRRVAQKLRDRGVPASVIWTEDWRGGNFEGDQYVLEEDWEVDRDLYPDFEQLASDLHDLGYKFLVYNNSFLEESNALYAEALAAGYSIRNQGDAQPYLFSGVKFRDSTLLDLSNPAARAWATSIYAKGLDAGADGWMADFGEWLPTDCALASGDDATFAHNLYPVEWQRLNKALFDARTAEDGVERLFFVRSAWLRSQPLVSVVWAGDQQTDWSAGDGYPSVIPIGLGLGMTGFPYFGHDIGGYTSQGVPPVSEELWYRWVTLGALSPVMRTHHGRAVNANWSWEKDDAATAHFARWATLHIRLFPYLYALADDAARTGAPMFRPLAFEYPTFEAGWTATDQFMLGDRIIVAPVIEEGATSRTVQLPPGTFYPLLGGAAVPGGAVTATAAKEDLPAFVPAGAMLALLPETIDTLAPASSVGVVDLADVGEDRELWLWPGGASTLAEAVGGLAYAWEATGLTGPLASATFDGQPVVVGETITVSGPGTLVLNGGEATLTITGGGAGRTTVVRVRGL